MKALTTFFSVRLAPDDRQILSKAARLEGVTDGEFVRRALENRIAQMLLADAKKQIRYEAAGNR